MKHVFVSSTFKDMQFERDELHKFAAPALDDLLMPYGEEVYFGDLRWGVNTTSLDSDEGSRRVLEVCLDEIDDCRPYMIVLIGERYGWIPDASLIRDAAAVKGLDLADEMSVTQLEIEYGALLSEGCEGRVFFYFRELDTTGMTEDQLRDYTAESELHRERIAALKERITALYPDAVRTYPARWDAAKSAVVGLKPFLNMVKGDLAAAFGRDLEEEESLPWQERAIRSAERHYLDLDKYYHPVEREPISLFDGFLAEERTLMRFVRGASGSGKSAFLAHSFATALADGDRREMLPFVLGLDKYSTCEMDYFKILLYKIEELAGMRDHYETTYGDPTFDQRVFDSINCLEGIVEGMIHSYVDNCSYDMQNMLSIRVLDEHLRYADAEYFGKRACSNEHLDFMIAYSSDEPSVILSPWFDYSRTYFLGDISEDDRTPLVKTLLRAKHKELADVVIDAIAEKEQSASPYYLKLVVDRMLMLDSEDFAAIRAMGDGMDNINRHQIAVVRSLADTTVGMASALISRVASRVNKDLVMRVIGLLTYGAIRMDEGDITGVFSTQGWDYSSLDFALATRSLSSILNYNPKDKSYAITNPEVIAAAEELLEEEGYSYVARSLFDHIIAIEGGAIGDALFRAASYVDEDFLAAFYVKQRRKKEALSAETDWLIRRRGADFVADILTRVATSHPEFDFSFIISAIPTACLTMDDREPYETLLQTILDNFYPSDRDESKCCLNSLAIIAWVKLVNIRMKVNTSDAAPLFHSFVNEGFRYYPMTPRARIEFDTIYYRFLTKEAFYSMSIPNADESSPEAENFLELIDDSFERILMMAHLYGAFATYLERSFEPHFAAYRNTAKKAYATVAEALERGEETVTTDDVALMIDSTLEEVHDTIRTEPEVLAAAIDYMGIGVSRVNSCLLKYLPRILAAAKYTFDDDPNDFNDQTINILRRLVAASRAVAGSSGTLDDFIYATVQMEQSYEILSDKLTAEEHIDLIRHFDRFTNITMMNADGNPRVLYRCYMSLYRLFSIFNIYDMHVARHNLLARITAYEFEDPEAPYMPELLIGSLVYAYADEKDEELRVHLRYLLDVVENEEEYATYARAYTAELMYVKLHLRSAEEIEEDNNYFSVDDGSIDWDDPDDDSDDFALSGDDRFGPMDDGESDGDFGFDPDGIGEIDFDNIPLDENGEPNFAEMLAFLEELGISPDDLFSDDEDEDGE